MTEPRQINVPVRTPNLPPWAAEPVAIAAAVGVMVVALVSAPFYAAWAQPLLLVVVVAWLVLCLGGSGRADPLGFLSIAVPLVLILAVATVIPADLIALDVVALAWIGVWTFLGGQVWPAWSRSVLRRMRPGSAEFAGHAADARIYRAWSDPYAVYHELSELWRLETPTTLPVTNGILALWDARADMRRDKAAFERVAARLREERRRLWIQPIPRLFRWSDPGRSRPSRSSRLEYRFPRLEALVALGSPSELAQLAAAAAAHATRAAGVGTPELEAALAAAARGEAQVGPLEALKAQMKELRALRDAEDPKDFTTEADAERGHRGYRQLQALASAEIALEGDCSPVAVADGIYDAICSSEPQDTAPYEAILERILGPERAAAAVEVAAQPRPAVPAQDGRLLGPFWTAIAATSGTSPGVLGLIVVGLLAGALGTVVRQGLRVFDWDHGPVDVAIGVLAVGLIAYAVLRPRMGRAQVLDVLLLFIISSIAQDLLGPAFDFTRGFIAPLIPDAWSAVFDNATTALPYAPWHAVLFAILLLAIATGLRWFGAAEPRATVTEPAR